MGYYIILKVGQHRAVVGSKCVRCDNDNEAVSAAYATTYDINSDCYAVEVWDDARIVIRVPWPEPQTSNQIASVQSA